MKDNIVFIHTLDLKTFFWLLMKRNKIDRAFYFFQKINPKLLQFLRTKISIEQTHFHDMPSYIQADKNLYTFIEELFKLPDFFGEIHSILRIFNLETEKLIMSLKKHVVNMLYDDIMILTKAQDLCEIQKNNCIIVNEYGLLRGKVDRQVKIRTIFSLGHFVKGYLLLMRGVLNCLRVLLKKRTKEINGFDGIKINIIFDQMYSGQEGNYEFDCFYRYFKSRNDVLYICLSKDSSIYRTLKDDRKPVLVRNDISLLNSKKLDQVKLFIKLFIRIIFSLKTRSITLKRKLLDVFYDTFYYEIIFEKFNPSYYLKIRSDYDSSHPVATAVADKYYVKHIGYQHGSYCFFQSILAYIDFHYYGVIGNCFRDDCYSQTWPQDIRYSILGPYSVERKEDKGCLRMSDKFVIGIFCNPKTSDESVDIYRSYPYQEGIEIIGNSFKKIYIPNLYLLFKPKGYKEFNEKIIKDLCTKNNLPCEIVYHDQVRNGRRRLYSDEVIATSDIVVVFSSGYSTTAWEALGKKKKLLVFGMNNFLHPFEKYVPSLVVRGEKEFQDSMKWLINISQHEYEKCIQPVIENCCKVSDGNLVKDFIEAIEHESKLLLPNGKRLSPNFQNIA